MARAHASIDQGGQFFEFRLIKRETEQDEEEERADPPLGWALSEAAQKNMNCQLGLEKNRTQLINLASASGLPGFDWKPALAHSKAICDRFKNDKNEDSN